MPHHIGDLFRRICGVHPAGHTTDSHGRQMTHEPFGSIISQNRHPIAGLKSGTNQPGRGFFHHFSIFIPGDSVPDTEFFAPQGNSIALGVDLLKKQVGEGGCIDPHYQVLLFL